MKGHWAREFPLTVTASGQASGTASESTMRARANALTSLNRPRVRVYVQIVYQGQFGRALLDTGCDVSVIGAWMLSGLAYQECREQLFAANSSPVPIAGSTELPYNIGGVDMKYEVLVNEAIEELIFGADWLNDHRCIWDFSRGVLYIRDGERPRPVTLWTAHRRSSV
jgi:predicted aspartyl protease